MRLVLLTLFFPLSILAQPNKKFVAKSTLFYSKLEYSGEGLFGFEKDGKFGYMDINQKVIIPATLDIKLSSTDNIPSFTNGYAVIKKDGMYGLLDKTGKIVVPCNYSSLWVYSPGKLVKASKGQDYKTLYGLITPQNNIVIPLEYSSLNYKNNYVTVGKNGKYGLKDYTGKDVLPFGYSVLEPYPDEGVALAEKDGKYGYIDLKGNWLFEKSKSIYTLFECTEGLIRCKVNNKYGYLDKKGNEVIITRYDYANDFNEMGLAKVSISNAETNYKTLYGYINKKGDEVIPLKYEILGFFKNGLVYAKDPETNRYGFLDKTGKWIIKPIYIYAGSSFDENGGTWVKMTDDKYHYINKSGTDLGIVDSSLTSAGTFKDSYYVTSNTQNPYALIDQTGKILKTIDDCDGIYSFSENIGGYKSKKTGLYGFLDINGNKIGEPEFTGFSGFSDGMGKVYKKIDGETKQGFVNTKGEVVIPIEYKSVSSFNDGWASVYKDSNYYFMDKKGELKNLPRKYDQVIGFNDGLAQGIIKNPDGMNTYYYITKDLKEAFSVEAKSAFAFWQDVAVIKRDQTYELINRKGESVKLLNDIDFLKFTKEGKLAVRSMGKWGYIDMKGNQVIPFQYDSCDSFVGDYAKVQVKGKWGIIDQTSKTIIEPKYINIVPGEDGVFAFYDSQWGIIDRNGKILSEQNFFTITPIVKKRALARLGKSFTILKSPLAK